LRSCEHVTVPHSRHRDPGLNGILRSLDRIPRMGVERPLPCELLPPCNNLCGEHLQSGRGGGLACYPRPRFL